MKKFLIFAVIILVLAAALAVLGKMQKRPMYQQGSTSQSGSYGSSVENNSQSTTEDMSDFDTSMDQVTADDASDDSDLSL